MGINDFKGRKWSGYIFVAFAAITFYVIISNLGDVWKTITAFLGNFKPLILGCVLAYLINPLAKLYAEKIFVRMPGEKARWTISVLLAVVTVIMLLGFLLGTLIPQLIDSVKTFAGNFDDYIKALESLAEKMHISKYVDMDKLWASSEKLLDNGKNYLLKNIGNIASASAYAGKSLLSWVLGLILSIYLLLDKQAVKNGVKRLFKAVFSGDNYAGVLRFFARCDEILARYIVYSLMDGMIIGIITAIFMAIVGMQYVGLVSVVVAVTNLIPTFGPIIGAVIGGFVLLLVNPIHALAFLVFTFILQALDGYVIKPKLFGDSLGISSLLILLAVIVGGNMFGVVGILLAIPFAAILDFVYKDYLLVSLEKRRRKLDTGTGNTVYEDSDEADDQEESVPKGKVKEADKKTTQMRKKNGS